MRKSKITRAPTELQQLSDHIGTFIEYWGFKRVHGRIWTHLFLANQPLSAGDLIQRLRVSKALISMSLADLLGYEVIREAGKGDRGTTVYITNPDLVGVVANVIRRREQRLIGQIVAATRDLKNLGAEGRKALGIDPKKLRQMGELVQSADQILDTLMATRYAQPPKVDLQRLTVAARTLSEHSKPDA